MTVTCEPSLAAATAGAAAVAGPNIPRLEMREYLKIPVLAYCLGFWRCILPSLGS